MIKKILTILNQRINRRNIYSTSSYWDSKAEFYDDKSVSMWPNNYLNNYYDKEHKDNLDRILGDIKGKRILDAGCGTGRISKYLAQKGALITGVDFSKNSIEIAKKHNNHTNIEYKVADIKNLKLNKEFDLILTWSLLAMAVKNTKELKNVLQIFYKHLIDNGELLLIEPIHKGFLHRVLKLSLSDFFHVLDNSGFSLIDYRALYFWPVRLILSYITWPQNFTVFFYNIGEFSLNKIFRNKRMGDYYLIYARKSKKK